MTETTPQANLPSLQESPILFWRVDILKRSFENLNKMDRGILGKDNYRFFKDSNYRDQLVLAQDLSVVNTAIADIQQRLPVSVIFRILISNTVHWFKLTGWPVGARRYYEGTVEEISRHIDELQDILLKRGRRLFSVDKETYPVAIFKKEDRHLVRFNQPFSELTGIPAESKKTYRLESLISTEFKLPLLEERLLLERRLNENLLVTPPDGSKIQAHCLLECFEFQNNELIRLSILEATNISTATIDQPDIDLRPTGIERLCEQFTDCRSVTEMLDAIFSQKDLLPGLDAVMYSDIYARKNSVFVYARGSLFQTLEPGSQYPYSGTIAENIEKEGLEYLIVDDTHASIKAIDWALFVPHGVHSYIAKALYVRGAMRTVLIFCSSQKQVFKERQVDDVTKIAMAFHRHLRQVKKH